MPAFLEARLRAQARKKGLKGRAADRYTFGAMNNMGAMHGNKETAKGAAMQAKHDAGKLQPLARMKARRRPIDGMNDM